MRTRRLRPWRPPLITVLLCLYLALEARRRLRARDDHRSRDEIIAQRSRDSTADFMQHGPRLWADRQTYVLARSGDGSRVLLGGVGGMGIGRMWAPAGPHVNDPTFAGAPVDDGVRDDFGENGRGELDVSWSAKPLRGLP